VRTCEQCHENAHLQFTGYLTHATHHERDKYPALYYAFWGMTLLLIGTFTFFGLHTLAWLPRSWKTRHALKSAHVGEKQFVRFPSIYRKMHFVVIVSFLGLALTGMVLKFSYMPWARAVARVMGGWESAGYIHRVCAVLTFGYFFVHLGYLVKTWRARGETARHFFFGPNTMLPTWRDVQEFWATVKWFWGKGPRPHYGRWTYWEKFDYFAVFWGVAIIGSTGLMLWFSEFFTRFLPGWMINVATIVHSDEALLATGFIFTIHFFNTHFRPEKFPMDTVIFTGRVPLEEFKLERPREYEELVERGELENHLADPVPLYVTRGVRFFGFAALGVGLSLVVLILYSMIFGSP
jgi:cytochrome b subunit of formate dehydrogenase